LLRACPGVRILATSQTALGVAGETAWFVPPLSLPERDQDLEALAGSEAVLLFVERGKLIRADFELTERNAAAVARGGKRLDGIPLALELAAARVKVLSVAQIADRLDDRFRLLGGKGGTGELRRRTLRATMDWSYDLLTDVERVVFDRLAVFAGGCSLEAT